MEKKIKDRYSESILQEAMQRYGIAQKQIRLLDGFESFIYEYQRDSQEYILRIGHACRRTADLIRGEIDWINYLVQGGASVARAVPSLAGEWVEAMDDGHDGQFLAVAFEKVQGSSAWESGWTDTLFETYGRLLGRMHTLSKNYQPSNPDWKRPTWNDTIMLDVERFIPPEDRVVRRKFQDLTEYLLKLPQDNASYGLIHQDAHAGNFLVDKDGNIILFDFDDCTYSWFINDIAIVLFYMVNSVRDPVSLTARFLPHFLKGYGQENQLNSVWFKEIPHFLKLREIDMYSIIHRSFDVNNLENPWCSRFMENRKSMIENDIPYIDFDFERLA